jgi:hypothetical protein
LFLILNLFFCNSIYLISSIETRLNEVN